MPPPLTSRVPAALAGEPLLAWLATHFRYHDEAGWREQLAARRVTIDDAVATGDEVLRAGSVVAFTPAAAAVAPVPVAVLHADDDLVVVDKPAHRIVQQAGAFPQHTFVGELARSLPPTFGADRLEPVHRLDRETSGVLVLARSPLARRALQQAFERREVEKVYTGVVRGVVAPDAAVLDAPIGPAPGSTIAIRRRAGVELAAGGRPARTELRVLQRLRDSTLVELVPRTGRTHQLRVHLEHFGHALVDDVLYGAADERYLAYVRHLKSGGDPRWPGEREVGRLLLHARTLRFPHPRSGAPLVSTAPWPPEFAAFVAARGGSAADALS